MDEDRTDRGEVTLDYDTFTTLWKRLVSKKKARKRGVDRDEVWSRLRRGDLGLGSKRPRDAAADEDAPRDAEPAAPIPLDALDGPLPTAPLASSLEPAPDAHEPRRPRTPAKKPAKPAVAAGARRRLVRRRSTSG